MLAPDDVVLEPWRTNCHVNRLLVSAIPAALWEEKIPGIPRRTVRMVAAHIHNSRSGWIKTLGVPWGIERPPRVDMYRVNRRELLVALRQSDAGIEALLELGLRSGGAVPPTKAYVWRNLPLDVGHVMAYFVAHEAHHRGQLLLVARQLGTPLPRKVVDSLWEWQWQKRAKRRRPKPNERGAS